ncbi:MAG: PIN domain-containing protein [Actinomycetota bacterium]|nr:PIN domain-containing protein [Actinomycetota bacterium]
MGTAITALDGLLTSASACVLMPGARHWVLLAEIIRASQVRGAVTNDAVLVAICREHGVDTLLTNDRDFRRFSGIRVELLTG